MYEPDPLRWTLMSGLGLVLVLVDLFLFVVPGYAMMEVVALLVGIYLIVLGMMRIAHGINERHEEQAITVKHL